MSIWKSAVRWFVKLAWPEILKFIQRLIPELLEWFYERIKEILKKKADGRQWSAQQNSEEAERRAAETKDESEAVRQKAIAAVWRQVAEDFRRDNEDLKAILELAKRDAAEAAKRNLQDLRPETLFAIEEDSFQLRGDLKSLLPPPPMREE